MPGRLREVAFASIGALGVLVAAAVLGAIYHTVTRWLFVHLHLWAPFLPGVLLGVLLGTIVRFWRAPLAGRHALSGAILAAGASLVLIGVRLHQDGGDTPAGRSAKSEWQRITAGLSQHSGASFQVVGTLDATGASPQIHGRKAHDTVLGAELALLLVTAEFFAWPRGWVARSNRTAAGPL